MLLSKLQCQLVESALVGQGTGGGVGRHGVDALDARGRTGWGVPGRRQRSSEGKVQLEVMLVAADDP